jgi:hypothetical protein
MKYEISGFKFDEVFTDKAEAIKRFEEVKKNFTYCELKEVLNETPYYYARSIKVYAR